MRQVVVRQVEVVVRQVVVRQVVRQVVRHVVVRQVVVRQVLVWQVVRQVVRQVVARQVVVRQAGSSEASRGEAGCTYFLTYCMPAVEGLEVGQPLDAGELGRDAGLVRVGVWVRASVRFGSGLGEGQG